MAWFFFCMAGDTFGSKNCLCYYCWHYQVRFLSVWMTVWRFYNCKVLKSDYNMVDQLCIFLSIPFGCHLELCLCDVQGFLSALRASPAVLSMWPCKNISHIQVLVTFFFPTPPIKLKLGLQTGGSLLIATHLDQSNYLANQKQTINRYGLTVPGLLQGSEKCAFFQVHSNMFSNHHVDIWWMQWVYTLIELGGYQGFRWWTWSASLGGSIQ